MAHEPTETFSAAFNRSAFMIKSASVRWCARSLFLLAACWLIGGPSRAEDRGRGITEVTKGSVDLLIPRDVPSGETQRYGLAFPFQVGPKIAALFVNVRMEGMGVGDFENGTDVILFDDVSAVAANPAIPIARNQRRTDPATGEKRILVTFPDRGGFVPFGAKREDGTPHPLAGSGFAFCPVLDFPMKENGAFRSDATPLNHIEFRQFSYDGREFRVVRDQLFPHDQPLTTADSRWRVVSPGMTLAISDGDDLLQPVSAVGAKPVCGVARWQSRFGVWRPVAFLPVPETEKWMEPSLTRDRDGTLLFTARNGDRTNDNAFALRVWRSQDAGANWTRIVDVAETRDAGPVAIGRATDGTPFILGNPVQKDRSYFRASVWLWPLNAARSQVEAPLTVRDAPAEFGSVSSGARWKIDHANSAVVRLADGKWRSVLVYRAMNTASLKAGSTPSGHNGCYVEEIRSRGPAVPAWYFAE
jgi:hypothetical protein